MEYYIGGFGALVGIVMAALLGRRGNDATAIAAITAANKSAMESLQLANEQMLTAMTSEIARLNANMRAMSAHILLLETTMRASGVTVPSGLALNTD